VGEALIMALRKHVNGFLVRNIVFAASKMGFVGSRISIVGEFFSMHVCMFFNMTWVGMNPKKWWTHQRSTGFSDIFFSASSSQTQLELVGISVVGLVNFEKKQSNASKKGGCFNVHVFFESFSLNCSISFSFGGLVEN